MKIKMLAKTVQKMTVDNSPAILTGLGVAGTVATAYLTGKATFKAAQLINEAENNPAERKLPLSTKERVHRTWKLYIPAVVSGASTITCIVAAHRIESRRTAAMAGVLALTNEAFDEYKAKVREKIGEHKEQQVRDEVAQDRVNRKDAPDVMVVTQTGKVMCHDAYSNQYFMSDMETLRRAENNVNAQILHSDFATVSDLYNFIDAEGLETTSVSGDMGWNTDKMLEINYSTVMYKEHTPCISIDFATVPIRDPWRFC